MDPATRLLRGTCGISFLGDLTVAETVALGERAEKLGVAALWMSETYFERDALAALTALALRTRTPVIGSGVASVFMRHPATLAMTFATLSEIAPGRVVAGLGTGVGNIVSGQLGYDYSKPVTSMREAFSIVRPMLDRSVIDVQGRSFSAREVALAGMESTPRIPVHLAGMGPRMAATAGELADGVHYAMPSLRQLAEVNEHVDAGATRAGRDPRDVERVAWLVCAVHEDPAVAKDIAREHIAVAMATAIGEAAYEREGLDPTVPGRLRLALERGGVAEAITLVDDDQVRAFAAAGSEDEVTAVVEGMLAAGATHPVLTAYGPYAANVLPVAARFPASTSS